MEKEEWWERFQSDKHKIIGCMITGINKSTKDGRKSIELINKKKERFAIAPEEGTKLQIHKQFRFKIGKKKEVRHSSH